MWSSHRRHHHHRRSESEGTGKVFLERGNSYRLAVMVMEENSTTATESSGSIEWSDTGLGSDVDKMDTVSAARKVDLKMDTVSACKVDLKMDTVSACKVDRKMDTVSARKVDRKMDTVSLVDRKMETSDSGSDGDSKSHTGTDSENPQGERHQPKHAKLVEGKNTLMKRLFKKKILQEKGKVKKCVDGGASRAGRGDGGYSDSLWMTTVRPRIMVTTPSTESMEYKDDSSSSGEGNHYAHTVARSKFYSTADISTSVTSLSSSTKSVTPSPPPSRSSRAPIHVDATSPATDISHLVSPPPSGAAVPATPGSFGKKKLKSPGAGASLALGGSKTGVSLALGGSKSLLTKGLAVKSSNVVTANTAVILADIYEEQDISAATASAAVMFSRDRKVRSSTGSMNTKTSLKCGACGFAIKPRDRVRLHGVDASFHRTCLKCSRCDVPLSSHNSSLAGRTMGDPLVCNEHSGTQPVKKEERSEDFFDLIANFQRGRFDDQRCELRPQSHRLQKSASIPHLDIKPAIITDEDRIRDMLDNDGPYPMVVDPLGGGYRCEGFVLGSTDMEWKDDGSAEQQDSGSIAGDSLSDSGSTVTCPAAVISQDSHINVYREFFVGREHINYISEDPDLPSIMSVGTHPEDLSETVIMLRTRTATYTKTIVRQLGSSDSDSSPVDFCVPAIAKEASNGEINNVRFQPVAMPGASRFIDDFDERFVKSDFKFGVIYQRFGQTKEECLFGNQGGSPAFDNFLSLLGDKVDLQGFQGFRGGLDTQKGQTGSHSVYSSYQGREVMFHVSTLLPYSEGDDQQLQRKRHIGNDIVTIVFQEENTPFLPNSIASHFLHAYIVVQPVDANSKDTKYKVSTACREDVPEFDPPLPSPSVFSGDECFRDFLLTKLVNAELSAHRASRFAQKMERTRTHYMNELHGMLLKRNEETLAYSHGPSLEKSASSGMIDSFRKFTHRKASSSSSNGGGVTLSASVDAGTAKRQSAGDRGTPQMERNKKKGFWARSHHQEKSRSWERNAKIVVTRTPSGGSTSLAEFRVIRSSQTSLSKQQAGDEQPSSVSSSPKNRRAMQPGNGRSTPSSMNSEEDLFRFVARSDSVNGVVNNDGGDSDTGVGSMSPADTTPNSTLEMRLHQSTHSSNGPRESGSSKGLYAEDNTGSTPDIPSKSGLELSSHRRSISYKNDYIAAKNQLSEMERKFMKTSTDLLSAKSENRKLQEEVEKLRHTEREEKAKLQSFLSSMSREEMV